jgi:RNA polymerase sigma factor (sigma-70 family)
MDVRAQRSRMEHPDGSGRRSISSTLRPRPGEGFDADRIAEVLGVWQEQEIRAARSFSECRGLSKEQLEDIYQETTVALLKRSYQNEEHLRNALRTGLKHRALNLHRDERRRGQILAYSAPGMYSAAEALAAQDMPELAAVINQDRLIVSEFLTELNALEQRVFWLLAEGMQYRAIAPLLGIDVNVARNASRACERKRQRFQLLYDTGRLCGFRSATILALQNGEATSEELAERAFAHLESCAHCRDRHRTNAKRLRRSFQDQATALLPMPALLGHLGWLTRMDVRARVLLYRFISDGVPAGPGVRERAAALLAGGGMAAKTAAGVATVVAVAGGAIGVSHVLQRDGRARHRPAVSQSTAPRQKSSTIPSAVTATPVVRPAATPPRTSSHPVRRRSRAASTHARSHGHRARPSEPTGQHEPGGFAYLGVPTTTGPAGTPEPAQTASQTGGGQFSP